jgi:hypothetical protein
MTQAQEARMETPQIATSRPRAPEASKIQSVPRYPLDDDLALGCECADPSLQIERWRAEIAAEPVRLN